MIDDTQPWHCVLVEYKGIYIWTNSFGNTRIYQVETRNSLGIVANGLHAVVGRGCANVWCNMSVACSARSLDGFKTRGVHIGCRKGLFEQRLCFMLFYQHQMHLIIRHILISYIFDLLF